MQRRPSAVHIQKENVYAVLYTIKLVAVVKGNMTALGRINNGLKTLI